MTTEDLRDWGYAPGNYMFRCHAIGCDVGTLREIGTSNFADSSFAAKGSWRCKECALKAKSAAEANPQPTRPLSILDFVAEHNSRVTELLAYNNTQVELRRYLEGKLDQFLRLVKDEGDGFTRSMMIGFVKQVREDFADQLKK